MKFDKAESKNLPTFPIPRIVKAAKTLESLLKALPPESVVGERFEHLYADVWKSLPQDPDPETLLGVLSWFSAATPEDRDPVFLAKRLAGNTKAMAAKELISLNKGEAKPGWCFVEIVDVEPMAPYEGRKRNRLIVECLAGYWAGSEATVVVSEGGKKLLAYNIGFSRFDKKLKFGPVIELVGLQFLAFVRASEWPNRPPEITEFNIKPRELKRNRKILHGRTQKCPLGHKHACWKCSVGREACQFSCRHRSFVEAVCEVCLRTCSMDPRHPHACYSCRVSAAAKGRRNG